MFGPMPKGHWSAALRSRPPLMPSGIRKPLWSVTDKKSALECLDVGKRYQVIRPFVDYDRDQHDIGETWIFLGSNFVPYEDGLSLFVSLNASDEWQIRLQLRAEEQEQVIDDFFSFVTECPQPA